MITSVSNKLLVCFVRISTFEPHLQQLPAAQNCWTVVSAFHACKTGTWRDVGVNRQFFCVFYVITPTFLYDSEPRTVFPHSTDEGLKQENPKTDSISLHHNLCCNSHEINDARYGSKRSDKSLRQKISLQWRLPHRVYRTACTVLDSLCLDYRCHPAAQPYL